MHTKQEHLLLFLYRPLGLAAATAGLPSAACTAAAAGLSLAASSNLAHLPRFHGNADCGSAGLVQLYSWKALRIGFQTDQSGLHTSGCCEGHVLCVLAGTARQRTCSCAGEASPERVEHARNSGRQCAGEPA